MVSSTLVDALTNPSDLLQQLYKSHNHQPDFSQTVSSYFSDIFASQDAFNEISAIGLQYPPEAFKPRSLVRFDSMVQDTACPPEIYLSRCANGECGGWGITNAADDNDEEVDYSLLQESGVVWVTSIPGQSGWTIGEDSSPTQATMPTLQPHKFPLPSQPHVAAQVKVYDSRLTEALRTTDLYSFVGILTFEPRSSTLESAQPIPVPTIHVLFARAIPTTIVPRSFPESTLLANVEDVRAKLISWIADEGLGGDRLAAELVLLTIVHKVQSRAPPLLPLTLTLSGFNSATDPAPKLVRVLSQLVPLCTVLPLSLDNVNNTSFFPESKEEDLHSGWLQLPKGSLCVVSEIPLNEGTVSERGLLNLKQVQETITHQTLDYAFPFSRYSFESDISFILLATGKQSAFFTTHHYVPIREGEAKSPSVTAPPPELLKQFRQLVGGAKVATIGLDNTTAAFIQDDFVNDRQTAQANKNAGKGNGIVTSDDLIIRMMVAKALAASLHSAEVTPEIWGRAKALERDSRARTV